jgi:hypothetical protein
MARDMATHEGTCYIKKRCAWSLGTASIMSSHPSMISERIQWTSRPSAPETEPSASTSVGQDQHIYHQPPPPDWLDRVNSQRAREDALRSFGRTSIPNQGVTFVGHVPYDVWTFPCRPLLNITVIPTEPVVKDESTHHVAHITLRHPNFVSNTLITPMSQQVYPGHLNPSSDPLLGSRIVGSQNGRDDR